MAESMLHPQFQEDLRTILNKHSMDNRASTPDFILAGMLTECLETYCRTVNANIDWHAPSAIGQAGRG